MKVGNKRFIDSYLFIPVPLASFPTTFGLAELKKGHFPHLLSSPESLKDPPEQLHEPGSCQEGASCIQLLSYSEDCEHCISVRDENAVSIFSWRIPTNVFAWYQHYQGQEEIRGV